MEFFLFFLVKVLNSLCCNGDYVVHLIFFSLVCGCRLLPCSNQELITIGNFFFVSFFSSKGSRIRN